MTDYGIKDLPLWSDQDTNKLFKKLCADEGISESTIIRLINLLRDYQHQERARGLFDEIADVLESGD